MLLSRVFLSSCLLVAAVLSTAEELPQPEALRLVAKGGQDASVTETASSSSPTTSQMLLRERTTEGLKIKVGGCRKLVSKAMFLGHGASYLQRAF